ncbi:MAG: DUF1493 family protein [Luteimonas sp.]|nr:DUF1493 family protein [Luteimonas sp.]
MSTTDTAPSFAEVVAFVRDFSGIHSKKEIAPGTRLEADLGVTGDDGDDLLQEAEKRFDSALVRQDGYVTTFGLAPNEYLFHPEALGLLGIGAIVSFIRGQPKHVVRDLTMGELHDAIRRNRRLRIGAA